MHFSKPYPTDYRKPKDAEATLDNQLQLTFSLLKEKGIKVRVWSFDKPRIIKNTTKFKTNTIGFYEEIREANKSYKAIIAVIDNFPAHKSKLVKQKAAELDISDKSY